MKDQESSIDKARRYAGYAEQDFARSGDAHEHTMRMATIAAEVSRSYSALATAEIVFEHVAAIADQLDAMAAAQAPLSATEVARMAALREAAEMVRAALQ